MLNITKLSEIDFSPADTNEHVYIFPKGVLVAIAAYASGKIDIQITNANYTGSAFVGRSFGGRYVGITWAKQNLEYWIQQSQGNSL